MDNKFKNQASNTVLKRTVGLICIFLIAAIVLSVHLFNIQINRHEELEQKATDQQTRDVIISANRGTIYDRNMVALAVSATVQTVYISPNEITSEEQARLIATGLSEILGVDYDTVYAKTQKSNYYEIIKRRIEEEYSDAVRKFISENKVVGIHLENDTKRYYPYSTLASHIIGFVGTDNTGLEGIEAYYDDYLSGVAGRTITAKNAKGTDLSFSYEKYFAAEDGYSLVTTLDYTVQGILEKYVSEATEKWDAEYGMGIVMNVKTGGILGLTVSPEYNLNNPWQIVDEDVYNSLQLLTGSEYTSALSAAQLSQWRNRAISDTYEPGSTFKSITMAMGLEQGVTKLTDTFTCTGSVMVTGWNQPIHCWKRDGSHATQDLTKALQNSCNVALIKIGQRIGAPTFYNYMKEFGLMDKTGIDLPGEGSSIIEAEKSFISQLVSLAVYSFGQRFTITPIQMISAIAADVNGGYLMTPHFVDKVIDSEGNVVEDNEPNVVRQVISQETSKTVCQMLEAVVSSGTGKNAYVKGYRVGGKTGTSEKAGKGDGIYDVSFVGVAPCDDPEIAILVVISEPKGQSNLLTGGYIAAPVVGSVLSEILPYLGVEADYTAEEITGKDVSVPRLTRKTLDEAIEALEKRNLSYRIVGEGEEITGQVPSAYSVVPNSSEIIIYMGAPIPEDKIVIPDLTGYTVESAQRTLKELGLYMRATGATSVKSSTILAVSQSYEAGTELDIGTVVEVKFLETEYED